MELSLVYTEPMRSNWARQFYQKFLFRDVLWRLDHRVTLLLS